MFFIQKHIVLCPNNVDVSFRAVPMLIILVSMNNIIQDSQLILIPMPPPINMNLELYKKVRDY
jgi:hypothetical protein